MQVVPLMTGKDLNLWPRRACARAWDRDWNWIWRKALACLMIVLLAFPLIGHAGLAPELQSGIRAGTFEVVLKKPTADPLTYEKPLPLDLLPFIERNDQYRSIGTAFALGNNRYVSAAHVFALALDSQFGAPALRSASGSVYAIDRITKFSLHGDFIVFSLSQDPAPRALPVNREPKIDTAVYAVGNALGEGIVIRDGIFTSATPEEMDGLWKWIRFSAAASPGNSGGPLLDEAGNVVGIVLRKSENENLNYSLPIGIVLDAPDDKAVFDERGLTKLPFMRGTRTYAYHDEFHLPLSWPDFAKATGAFLARHFDESLAELDQGFAATQFIRGLGVDGVVFSPDKNIYDPKFIKQQSDDTWITVAPQVSTTQLPDDGFVAVGSVDGVGLLRLHRSGNASDDAFYVDSKAFMDVALKGLGFIRQVGRDEIRITSVGPAQTEKIYTDQYGRTWQERVWPMPYQDTYIVSLLLPTPDGYDGLIQAVPSATLRESESLMRRMTAQFAVSYLGAPAQWEAFLRRPALLPKTLTGVTLLEKPNWQLHTPRFQARILSSLFPIGEKGTMGLIMGFVHQADRLECAVVGATWAEDAADKSTVSLKRTERPPMTATIELRTAYAQRAARRPPFGGDPQRETADGYAIGRVLDVPGAQPGKSSSDLLYSVTVHLSGKNAFQDIVQLSALVTENLHILEHGVGPDTEPYHEAPAPEQSTAPGFAAADFAVIAGGGEDSAYGQDIRGRHISEDFRDYVLASSSRHPDAIQSSKIAGALFDYWRLARGEVSNRDLWASFLERNGLSATMGHRSAVLAEEAKLINSLDAGVPGTEWAQQARSLIDAYAKERADMAKSRADLDPTVYAERQVPCPQAALQRSDTQMPTRLPFTRSPNEFYPNTARRLEVVGAVVVAVRVDASGCGRQRGVVASSGSEDIDQAALEFMDTIEYLPAQRDGAAIDGIYKTIVSFKLAE